MARHVTTLTLHGLRVRRSSLISWCIALALTMAAFVAMYPSIAAMDISKIADQYPEGLLKAFGITSMDGMSSAGGYLNLELFGAILPLALIFLPIGFIAHALTGNEGDGYLAPLLALPISRRAVLAAACAGALGAALLAIATIVLAALTTSVLVGAGLAFNDIAQSSLATLPLMALATGIAALVAGVSGRRGLPTAVAAVTLVAMYLMQVLASFSSFFHDIRGVSAFNYYNQWINGSIDPAVFAAVLIVSAVLMVAGGHFFSRRDIRL